MRRAGYLGPLAIFTWAPRRGGRRFGRDRAVNEWTYRERRHMVVVASGQHRSFFWLSAPPPQLQPTTSTWHAWVRSSCQMWNAVKFSHCALDAHALLLSPLLGGHLKEARDVQTLDLSP